MKPLFWTASLVRRYLTFMRTTVSTKGQIILPPEIRREDDIKSGQEFEIERIDRGEYLLKRTTNQILLSELAHTTVES